MKKLLKIGIIVAIVFFALYSCVKKVLFDSIISVAKDGYFCEELSDVTIGEIMETLCTDSKWECTLNEETGLSVVTYTGKAPEGQTVEMGFHIFTVADTHIARLSGFSVDGQEVYRGVPMTAEDELLQVPFALYEAYKIKTRR